MGTHGEAYDPEIVRRSSLYRLFHPVMGILLTSRIRAMVFLLLGGDDLAAQILGGGVTI